MDDATRIRIRDMVEYATKAADMVGERTAADLAGEDMRRLAVVHAVQIVGEAARKVPDAVRERAPSIAWRAAIAMRNILVHDYGDVNLDVLISTVADDFPPLIADLERLLSETNL
ncbi:MAG: DUF86 domain-containing protein [Brevundimonas sp.]|nr:MAG: DUF86 domain-containing protein [Brevundimonas sp.]